MPPSAALKQLGARERQIMDILFRAGRATATEVQEALGEPLSNSAVRGMLRLLTKKGLVAYSQDGPRYVYRPLLRPDDARRSALTHVVGTFFKNSKSSAIAALLDMDREPLSDEEYERLSELLEKARKHKGGR
jgi:BlaI family transcriptional regulator, penicillinase repressor